MLLSGGVIGCYLKLLIFLLAILFPTCASKNPAFLMMYSAYKLNKQGDLMIYFSLSYGQLVPNSERTMSRLYIVTMLI